MNNVFCLIFRSLLLGVMVTAGLPAAAENPSTITKNGNQWTMENDRLRTIVAFNSGSIQMTSFYNKTASREYLGSSSSRHLFWYQDYSSNITYANDGGWTLGADAISDITYFGKTWGKKLEVTVTRTSPVPFQVRLVFEMYNGSSGLRYVKYLKNNSASSCLRIVNSEVLSLDLPNTAHTINYANRDTVSWGAATGTSSTLINAICVYGTGDGWAILPELNWRTDGDPNQNPFGYLNAWSSDSSMVKFVSVAAAVQLDLFPQEEFEYLSVNLTTFLGDAVDGRMAVQEHFRNRFKYWAAGNRFASNDWDWYRAGLRTEAFYRNTCVPQAVAAGLDAIYIDDEWSENHDTLTAKESFTADLPGLMSWIRDQGLGVGLWWQLSAWYDIADPATITYRTGQIQNTLINQYGSIWQQVDLCNFWVNQNTTAYSHAWDSCYRKVRRGMDAAQGINRANPDYLCKFTPEVDLGWAANQNNGLIHVVENGEICPTGPSDPEGMLKGTLTQLFGCLGVFPIESLSMYCAWQGWKTDSKHLYTWFGGRDAVLYSTPSEWTNVSRVKAFCDWKRTASIAAIRHEIFRPVNLGASNNYAWMYVTEDKTKALLIACGGSGNFNTAGIRWLSDTKNYQITNISYLDDGTFLNSAVGAFSGSTLRTSGLAVNFASGNSYGAAYWIEDASSTVPSITAQPASLSVFVGQPAPFSVTVGGTVPLHYQWQTNSVNIGHATNASYTTPATTLAENGLRFRVIITNSIGSVTSSVATLTVLSPDNTKPTVSMTAPAAGATVSNTVTVSATATDNVAVAGVQFKFDGVNLGAEDTNSPYSISWDTWTAANGSHTLTAVARDAAGNATTSTAVNVTSTNGGSVIHLLNGLSPVQGDVTDGVSYELGMKFTSTQAGSITAVRYWKAPSETGAHTGRIWSSSGTQLAAVTFTDESASGWQEQALPTPLSITTGAIYVVTVNCNDHYADTVGGLATAIQNPPLRTVADGANGMFGVIGQFPTQSWNNSNYFRDILFSPSTNPPPTISTAAWADPNPVALPAGVTVDVVAIDPDGDSLTYAWSKVSGPGTTTFATPTGTTSTVSFSAAGTYVLRITVVDGHGGMATSEVTVVVVVNDPELRITGFGRNAVPGEFILRWQSASNHRYTVQAATNLLTGFTLNLRTNILAIPPENVHTDNVQGVGMKFYRVTEESVSHNPVGWPDASNTGPTGTLTASGPITVTQDGAVIQNLNVSGSITIRANNVTIRNCQFGGPMVNGSSQGLLIESGTGTVVEDSYLTWAGTQNFTLRRCEMSSASADLIRVSGPNITIEDCYLHVDGPMVGGEHTDIIQEYPGGGSNIVVRHNTMYVALTQNAVLNGPSNVLVENNLMAGAGFTIYANESMRIINNHFSTKYFPQCGYWGVNWGTAGQWTGNVWHETGLPCN